MLDSQRRTSAGVPLLADAQNTLQDFDPTYSGFGSDQAGVSSTPPSVAPEPGPYSHLLPPLTLLALFCDYCTLTAIIPIVPLTLPDSIDNSYIFLLFSSKALFQLIANPFVGRLVDRKAKESDCCSVDPPMIFIASLLVLILSTLGFAYAVDLNAGEGDSKDPWFQYFVLLGCRCVQGMSSSGILSAGMSTISLTTPPEKRGGALGTAMIGIAAGVLLGPPIAGVLAQFSSNGLVFTIIAGIGTFTLVCYMLLLVLSPDSLKPVFMGEGEEEEDAEGGGEEAWGGEQWGGGGGPLSGGESQRPKLNAEDSLLRWSDSEDAAGVTGVRDDQALLKFAPVFLLLLAVCVANTAVAISEPLIPLFLAAEPFGFDEGQVGLTFGVMSLSYLVFTPVFGFLSDKRTKTPFMVAGLFCIAAGNAVVLTTDLYWLLVVGLALIGVGIAGCDTPSMPLLTLLVPPERFGAAMALQDSAVSLGFLVGPILAIGVGENRDQFKWLCISMALVCVFVVPFMGVLSRYEQEMERAQKMRQESHDRRFSGDGDVAASFRDSEASLQNVTR